MGVWSQIVVFWYIWQEYGFNHSEVIFTFYLLYKGMFINFVLLVQFTKVMLK